MKSKKTKVSVDQLIRHPYHEKTYDMISSDYLERSIKETGNQPVFPIVCTPIPEHQNPEFFNVISHRGMCLNLFGGPLGIFPSFYFSFQTFYKS